MSSDIVDIFLSPANRDRLASKYGFDRGTQLGSKYEHDNTCALDALMHEFIYGPYRAGAYDIWPGTSTGAYLKQMNDEFGNFLASEARKKRATRGSQSMAREIFRHEDPFRLRVARDHRSTHSNPHIVSRPGALQLARDSPLTARRDALYADWAKNKRGLMQRTTRDDDMAPHDDDVVQRETEIAEMKWGLENVRNGASMGAARSYIGGASNPFSQIGDDSGDVQYHLVALDAEIGALNPDGPTMPIGYGNEEARMAEAFKWRADHSSHLQGACGAQIAPAGKMRTSRFKKIVSSTSACGRNSYDLDRYFASDSWSGDSRDNFRPKRML